MTDFDNDFRDEIEIQHTMDILADMIPYDDPEYSSKLRQLAEHTVEQMHHHDFDYELMCKEHDRLLELGVIDH
jgi:hypothetical protein